GAALLGLALTIRSLTWAFIWYGLLGLGAAWVAIPLQTLLQAETPEAMRGKVFGFQNNAVNIALSLPLAVVGVAAARLGLPMVLVGLAGLVTLLAVW
ncbi:MAG: hypothetical protein Q6K59_05405, partial [Gloeomargarita sp. GMQP_bins_25]